MMLNTQYNTPNVGLFKLFLLTHFVPRRVCPKGFYIFTIFGRMPGFVSKMLRMQPGVQFSQISHHKMSSFKCCIIWQHILYICKRFVFNKVTFNWSMNSGLGIRSFALVAALLEKTTRALCYLQKEQQERISPFALYKKSKLLLLLFLKERLDQNELIAIFTFLNT